MLTVERRPERHDDIQNEVQIDKNIENEHLFPGVRVVLKPDAVGHADRHVRQKNHLDNVVD